MSDYSSRSDPLLPLYNHQIVFNKCLWTVRAPWENRWCTADHSRHADLNPNLLSLLWGDSATMLHHHIASCRFEGLKEGFGSHLIHTDIFQFWESEKKKPGIPWKYSYQWSVTLDHGFNPVLQNATLIFTQNARKWLKHRYTGSVTMGTINT